MRKEFPGEIEKGRCLSGTFASKSGERMGAFFVRCPMTGEELKIIVGDGSDWQAERLPGEPWEHVSVSCARRCPTWDEMHYVKDAFFADDECVIQFHPPRRSYINNHPFVLHLWRPVAGGIAMPPRECV